MATATATQTLPDYLQQDLTKLCSIDDEFIRYATLKELRYQYPMHIAELNDSWPQICEVKSAEIPIADKPAITPSLAVLADFKTWEGELETSADFNSGNTDKYEFSFAGKLKQEVQEWRNTIVAKALNGKEQGIRFAEEYRASAQSDFKLNPRDYIFGRLGYVNDDFSGYNYRLTEVAGIGRRWIDDGEFLLDTRIGPGFRQSLLTDDTRENSWLAEFNAEASWKFNDYFQIGDIFHVEYTPDSSILNSQAFVKSRITETLSFKTAVEVEHITKVPTGRQNTDTRTNVGVVYGF